jgi:hypothetical protein
MLAFAALLARTSPHLRKVRYLFISSYDPDVEGTDESYARYILLSERMEAFVENERNRSSDAAIEEEEMLDAECSSQYNLMQSKRDTNYQRNRVRSKPKAVAFETILRLVASTLEILEVDLDSYTAEHTSEIVSLPSLTDLTTHGGFPLKYYQGREPPVQLLEPCHSLRRLHVVERSWLVAPFYYLDQLSFAPSVSHLRFSNIQDGQFPINVGVALGVRKPWGHRLNVGPFPPTIERILIQPSQPPRPNGRCGTPLVGYMNLLRHSRVLQRDDSRFVLLQAQSAEILDTDDESGWLDLVNGGKGCWDETDTDCYDDDAGNNWE